MQVVLGTESGMVTAIVRKVQAMLQASGRNDIAVEIVFPVASEAITTDSSARPGPAQNGNAAGTGATLPGGLPVVPGPAGGEGCSAEGGCASCPYMKVQAKLPSSVDAVAPALVTASAVTLLVMHTSTGRALRAATVDVDALSVTAPVMRSVTSG